MLIALILLSVLTAVLIGYLILYRRQTKKICRQLRYVREHKTEMLITSDMLCFNKLTDEINKTVSHFRAEHIADINSDDRLKQEITELSHDIRTPLTSLNGYFELLCESEERAERERYAAVIKQRIDCLSDMLEQLFTYTKLRNNSYNFVPEAVDETQILCDILLSFYADFEKLGITPEISIPEIELKIVSNELALTRVFQNIIKNVFVHGTKHFTATLFAENGYAVAKFTNCCDDLDSVDIEKLFQKFIKSDGARAKGSTGLGLAIAKELSEKTGGSISAEKDENSFTVTVKYRLI